MNLFWSLSAINPIVSFQVWEVHSGLSCWYSNWCGFNFISRGFNRIFRTLLQISRCFILYLQQSWGKIIILSIIISSTKRINLVFNFSLNFFRVWNWIFNIINLFMAKLWASYSHKFWICNLARTWSSSACGDLHYYLLLFGFGLN